MDVTHAIAEMLKAEGVEYLFGFPSNPLLDTDAAEDAGIRTIVVRQERTGVHMADAIGRLSAGEKVGVFCCQHGPGTENSVGGVAQAYGESAPIVAFPAGYDRPKTDTDPKFNSLINYQHITKHCEQLKDPAAVSETVRRAFSAARNGRPRPAVVEIPKDVFSMEVGEPAYESTSASRAGPDPKAVETAVDLLLDAVEPVIFVGQGVHYAQAWEPLQQLAALLDIPVATSLNGKSAFPEDHELSLGAASKSKPGPLVEFMDRTDCLLGIGCSFTDTAYGLTPPTDNTIIHSTLDPTDIDKDVTADHAVVGDAALVLDALVAEAQPRLGDSRDRRDSVVSAIASARADWLDDWQPKLEASDAPINPYRVVNELNKICDKDNTIITHDAGNARDFLAPFYDTTSPLSYIGWGKTTQLGYGLGLTIGAKLLNPEKTCINVWGDGAIGMTGLDFETAVREDLPILSVLLNNYEMAAYDTPFSGDWATVAEGLGGYGERIEDPAAVPDALERGIQKTRDGTPVLLEFITARENELSLTDRY